MSTSCPNCKTPIGAAGLVHEHGIWCPSCRTVWMRTGEREGVFVTGPRAGSRITTPDDSEAPSEPPRRRKKSG